MIIKFKNTYDQNASDVIAINTKNVISVYEIFDPSDKKKKRKFTCIYCNPDLTFTVDEPIDDVIVKINSEFPEECL